MASAAVDMMYSEGADEALAEGRPEIVGKIAAALVEIGNGFDCLSAAEVEDFAAEIKLEVVHVVVEDLEFVHLAGFDVLLPGKREQQIADNHRELRTTDVL